MNNLNLIDNYLANRMNDAEKNAFESRLESDPELKQEFKFHKEIVNSIREERKGQLKSMLNSIPVSPSSPGSILGSSLKAIGTVAGISAVIAAAYFFTKNEEPAPPITEETEVQAPLDALENKPAERPSEPAEQDVENTPSDPVEAPVQPTDEPSALKENKPAEIKAPNLVEDFESDNNNEEINEPDAFTEIEDLNTEELFNSNIEVIIDNSKKKLDFHYQFKNEKLYLFGTFDEGLYEILEFNNDQEQTIILYYKESYYLINGDNQEIAPLKPIEDTSLTEKLDKLRKE
jgi:hypothetical protein